MLSRVIPRDALVERVHDEHGGECHHDGGPEVGLVDEERDLGDDQEADAGHVRRGQVVEEVALHPHVDGERAVGGLRHVPSFDLVQKRRRIKNI